MRVDKRLFSVVVAAALLTSGEATAEPTKLRDVAQRISDLRAEIEACRARLGLLADSLMSGGDAGASVGIEVDNELSSAFRVTRVVVLFDGGMQYNKKDSTGALGEEKSIPIFDGSIPPGDHTVQAVVELQGHGFGIFSYLSSYKFEIRSTHSFTAVPGKRTKLRIAAYEKGGVTTPLEQRPAIRYVEDVAAR